MAMFRVNWSKDVYSQSFTQMGPYTLFQVVFSSLRDQLSECVCYARAQDVQVNMSILSKRNGVC